MIQDEEFKRQLPDRDPAETVSKLEQLLQLELSSR